MIFVKYFGQLLRQLLLPFSFGNKTIEKLNNKNTMQLREKVVPKITNVISLQTRVC